jgi:hypothetical protein
MGTRHRKTDTGNIGQKIQKDRYEKHWTQDTKRQIRVTLDTRHTKIDKCNIGNKTQKDRYG